MMRYMRLAIAWLALTVVVACLIAIGVWGVAVAAIHYPEATILGSLLFVSAATAAGILNGQRSRP